MSFEKILLSRSEGGTPPAVIFHYCGRGTPPPAVAILSQKSKIFACCALLGLKIGTKYQVNAPRSGKF